MTDTTTKTIVVTFRESNIQTRDMSCCDICWGSFRWKDEVAWGESVYGPDRDGELVVVCRDCYELGAEAAMQRLRDEQPTEVAPSDDGTQRAAANLSHHWGVVAKVRERARLAEYRLTFDPAPGTLQYAAIIESVWGADPERPWRIAHITEVLDIATGDELEEALADSQGHDEATYTAVLEELTSREARDRRPA